MCLFVVKMQRKKKKNPKFSQGQWCTSRRGSVGLRTNACTNSLGGISHLFELWAESISVYSLAWRLVALLLVPVKSVAAVATGNAACIMNSFAC